MHNLCCRTITLLCAEGGWEQGAGKEAVVMGESLLRGEGLEGREESVFLFPIGLCHILSSLLLQCLYTGCFSAWNTSLCYHKAPPPGLSLREAFPDLSKQQPRYSL